MPGSFRIIHLTELGLLIVCYLDTSTTRLSRAQMPDRTLRKEYGVKELTRYYTEQTSE